MDALTPKLIYLARRNPALTPGKFRARWREHGRLGMSRPRWVNVLRYVQSDVVRPGPGFEHILGDEDAIGFIWHRSPEHRRAHLADATSRVEMEADEAATFAEPIVATCLVAREIVMEAPGRNCGWKLTRFSETAGWTNPPAEAQGYVRNAPFPPEHGSSWGLASRSVEEFWFASRAAAERAAGGLEAGAKMLLSRDVQLYP